MNSDKIKYTQCSKCVMDTSDPLIQFDDLGVCNHCRTYDDRKKQVVFLGEKNSKIFEENIKNVKKTSKNKKYDCILGLSGGVDSSYLAYWAVKHAGLRVLAVHVDCGWNSEIASSNIENIVKKLQIDLVTEVINWNEMRDLQISYLKSGVANQDSPQDHAIFASLYKFAIKNKIKTVLGGYNFSTESILPPSWGYSAMDLDQLSSIHNLFGTKTLSTFPRIGFCTNYIFYPYIVRLKVLSPLNYINYNKNKAIEILKKELDWNYYGGKHYESKFTSFFQSFWLPTRFGYDKRKAHLSSLILANQISREDALEILKSPPYNHRDIIFIKRYISRKLKISLEDLNKYLTMPKVDFTAYKTNQNKFKFLNFFRYIISLPHTLFKRVKCLKL